MTRSKYLGWRDVLAELGRETRQLDSSEEICPLGRDWALLPFLGSAIVTFCLFSVTSICCKALVRPDNAEPIW